MTREQVPRRQKKDRPGRQVSLEQQFSKALRLHAEATAQQHATTEREKVLCDQVLHQQFFNELLATVGEPSGPNAGSQQQHAAQQNQHVPHSYVAQLLQKDVSQQLQRVLKMTARDWLRFFADAFPKLLCLLELCHRSEQQDGATAVPCAGQPESTVHAPLQAAQDMGRAPPGNETTATDVGMPPTAPCCPSSPAGSSILAQWFGGQPPLGQSPAADYQQLQEAVDHIATHVMLAYVFNHVPLLEACAFSFSPGPQVRPTAQHWEQVADRLQLTELQQLHWTLCLAEYRRLNQSSRADGGALLQEAATPSLLVAAAELQQQRQQQQRQQQQQLNSGKQQRGQAEPLRQEDQAEGRGAGGRSRSARRSSRAVAQSTPACGGQQQQQQQLLDGPDGQGLAAQQLLEQQDDGEEGGVLDELGHNGQDRLQEGLQHYVQRRHVHLLSTATFFVNSLSQWQLALLISHSYPWIPSLTAAAEVVTKRWQAKQQQQVQRIQLQAVQQQGLASLPGSRAESPAAVVVPGTSSGSSQGGGGVAGGAGTGGMLAREIQQHEQRRVAELELHRQLCWAQVNEMQQEQEQVAADH